MPKFAVLGNAVVDCMAHVPPSVIERFKLTPNDSNYLPQAEMFALNEAVPAESFRSGGLGANMAWTLAKLGHPTCFMARVGKDSAGQHFFEDMVKGGVSLSPLSDNLRTTEIFILVTPGGGRTMVQQQPPAPSNDDSWVLDNDIEESEWLVFSTYTAITYPAATLYALKQARKMGKSTCILLGSPKAVEGAATTLATMVEEGVDLIIGHEKEYETLLSHSGTVKEFLEKTPRVLTRGAGGAVFVGPGSGQTVEQTVAAVPNPADITGAGDAFAAGFLAVYAAGGDISEALRRGHQLGRACVQYFGPRLPDPVAAWNGTFTAAA